MHLIEIKEMESAESVIVKYNYNADYVTVTIADHATIYYKFALPIVLATFYHRVEISAALN